MIVGFLYRHPNNNNDVMKSFINNFKNTISLLNNKNVKIIIMGDININLMHKNNPMINKYINFLIFNKLIILNNNITRYSSNKSKETNTKGTAIDHIYFRNNNYKCKNNKLIINNGTITVAIADHEAI